MNKEEIEKLVKKFKVDSNTKKDKYIKKLKQIEKEYINPKPSYKDPNLFFAAGQPGAGKTALIKKIEADFPDRVFTVIDLDDFRKFHPNAKKILEYPQLAPVLTNSFVFDVEEDILTLAISGAKDIIYVSTLRDTDFVINTIMQKASIKQYKIGLYVIAVPYIESVVAAQERYEKQLKNGDDFLRFTNIEFHKEADKGFLHTISVLENNSDISFIKVLKRGKTNKDLPNVIYDSQNNGFKSTDVTPMDKIHKVRNSLGETDLKDVEYRIENLYQSMKQREITNVEKIQLQGIYSLYTNMKQNWENQNF